MGSVAVEHLVNLAGDFILYNKTAMKFGGAKVKVSISLLPHL